MLQGKSTEPFDKTLTLQLLLLIPNTSASGAIIIRPQPVVDIGVSGLVLATTTSEMERQQEVILSLSMFAGLAVYISTPIVSLNLHFDLRT